MIGRHVGSWLALLTVAPGLAPAVGAVPDPPAPDVPRLRLHRAEDAATGDSVDRGTFTVWEDRDAKAGRTLDLDVVVLRARAEEPEPDPVFLFAGGPGLAAADRAAAYAGHWMRDHRDVVLLSQRGTGGSNRLDCAAPGDPGNLQAYLDQVFRDPQAFRERLDALGARADLRWYGTATAMEDVDELRDALGYERINVVGGSYGSRAALEYVRRHRPHVRAAIVSGVAPVAFLNPLHHASSAQRAIDLIFDECAADPACAAAYGDLRAKLSRTLARLAAEPGRATVVDGAGGRGAELRLTRDAFAEALRVLMYYDSRRIPYLLDRAFAGDYDSFARAGLASNRAVRDLIAFGMLLCVTCGEDVDRIDPDAVAALTAGTFLGDVRVRQQMAICAFWPDSRVPADHGAPLRSEVPVLMLSGTHDPVTPPAFAEDAARHLPNAEFHVVAPGSHGVAGACIEAIERQFLERGTGRGVDVSCVDAMDLGPFYVEPADDATKRPG